MNATTTADSALEVEIANAMGEEDAAGDGAPPESDPPAEGDDGQADDDTGDGAPPDGEPASGDEQTRQADQQARLSSDAEIEKAMQSLEREALRHTKRIGEIMGEDAIALVPCELCAPNLPGFRFPIVPSEPVRDAVKAAIGLADTTDYNTAPDASECGACNGLGIVLSGSKVARFLTLQCLSCEGRGYLSAAPARIAAAPPTESTSIDIGNAPELAPLPDLDQFGTPAGHPDYGKLPQYRQFPLPAFVGDAPAS